MQNAIPGQVLRDHQGRGLIHKYVSPRTESNMTFAAKGISWRLGTATEKSWAISHVHVAYIDQLLENVFHRTVGKTAIRNQRWCYDSKQESEVKLEQFVSLSMKGL